MDVIIRETVKTKLKNPTIIEGFPGIGMIGTIACSYINHKLGLKLVGTITSNSFPPIASVHDYTPVHPVRIYASEKHNLILIYSEMVIPMEAVHALTKKIIEFAQEKNAETIISLAGMQIQTPSNQVYGITSKKALMTKLLQNNIEAIKEGSIQGVSGTLIAEAAINDLNAINLLAQTNTPLDPRGAALLLDKLGGITDLKIDTSDLIKEANSFESKIKDTMNTMKQNTRNYEKIDSTMYA